MLKINKFYYPTVKQGFNAIMYPPLTARLARLFNNSRIKKPGFKVPGQT